MSGRGLLDERSTTWGKNTPKPAKEKKKRRKPLTKPSKSKKAKVEDPKADLAALTPEVSGSPRAEGEEKDDSSVAPEGGENLTVPHIVQPVASKTKLDVVIVLPRAEEAFEGVSGNVPELVDDQNIPRVEAKVLYNQTFARFQAKLTRYEGECMKLTSEADELRAFFTKKEEEFSCLQDCFEAASRERTYLIEQLEKKRILMKDELRTRDSEISELKWYVSEIASERDTLQRKVVLVVHQLHDARAKSNKYKDLHTELVVVLYRVMAEAEELVSSYKEDVVATNAQARKGHQFICRDREGEDPRRGGCGPAYFLKWTSLPSNDQINEWKERVAKVSEKLEYLEYSLLELEGKVRKRVTDCQNAEGNEGEYLAKTFLPVNLRELEDLMNESIQPEEGPTGIK
ncbi:uncharacterized protein [Nicotiana sylvestris]|uniref:uncharacterized protein n=1 Tax=Nicotiana sylvestris TaxID=4096 RepID=UPI00388CE73E